MAAGIPITPEQLAEGLKYRRRGWTNDRIAAQIKVHPAALSRAFARHYRRAMKRLEARTAAIKADQYEQLQWLAEQASDGWERSQEDAITVKVSEVEDDEGKVYPKTETTTKGQAGDSRFLSEFRAALADQRKVLGLEKIIQAGPTQLARLIVDFDAANDDQADETDGAAGEVLGE